MEYKTDRGVAGLTILLSLVVMLFIIGLIVMIFTLMGTALRDASYTSTDFSTVMETGYVNYTGYTLDNSSLRDFSISSIVIFNTTEVLAVGNYTITAGVITNATDTVASGYLPNTTWSINYTGTWNDENSATTTINETTSAIAGVTDWFSIFIVIGAMVVLILLTVIIITAIRGSGMIEGGTVTGQQNVGSA